MPGRPTYGPAVAKVGGALGWRFMPWQRQVAAVTGEIDPATGEYVHPLVVITVQRQAGKTVLVGANSVHRCLTTVDRECWYTAQTRTDARKNFMKLVRRVRRSPLAPPFAKIRESNGSEAIEFAATGSSYGLFAPTDEALHGTANALVNVDEAWAFDTVEGASLLQAIMPTFSTVDGQLWIFSAAGGPASTWLRELVDAGRLAAAAPGDPLPGSMAYFEFGIPEHVDPGDIDAVMAHHPANGFTLRRDALVSAASVMSQDEFARAFGNRWAPTGAPSAIPELVWRMAGEPRIELPAPGVLALALEVGQDGRDAAILAAWRDASGVANLELVDHREGTSWVVPRLVELVRTLDPVAVRYDRMGPAVAVGDEAHRAGVDIEPMSTDDMTGACAGMLAGLAARTIRYRPHPALSAAAAAASTRPVGDRWVWARRSSGTSIAALVAATVAVWAYDHAERYAPFGVG